MSLEGESNEVGGGPKFNGEMRGLPKAPFNRWECLKDPELYGIHKERAGYAALQLGFTSYRQDLPAPSFLINSNAPLLPYISVVLNEEELFQTLPVNVLSDGQAHSLNYNISLNDRIEVEVRQPRSTISFELRDWDDTPGVVGMDDKIGYVDIPLQSIIPNKLYLIELDFSDCITHEASDSGVFKAPPSSSLQKFKEGKLKQVEVVSTSALKKLFESKGFCLSKCVDLLDDFSDDFYLSTSDLLQVKEADSSKKTAVCAEISRGMIEDVALDSEKEEEEVIANRSVNEALLKNHIFASSTHTSPQKSPQNALTGSFKRGVATASPPQPEVGGEELPSYLPLGLSTSSDAKPLHKKPRETSSLEDVDVLGVLLSEKESIEDTDDPPLTFSLDEGLFAHSLVSSKETLPEGGSVCMDRTKEGGALTTLPGVQVSLDRNGSASSASKCAEKPSSGGFKTRPFSTHSSTEDEDEDFRDDSLIPKEGGGEEISAAAVMGGGVSCASADDATAKTPPSSAQVTEGSEDLASSAAGLSQWVYEKMLANFQAIFSSLPSPGKEAHKQSEDGGESFDKEGGGVQKVVAESLDSVDKSSGELNDASSSLVCEAQTLVGLLPSGDDLRNSEGARRVEDKASEFDACPPLGSTSADATKDPLLLSSKQPRLRAAVDDDRKDSTTPLPKALEAAPKPLVSVFSMRPGDQSKDSGDSVSNTSKLEEGSDEREEHTATAIRILHSSRRWESIMGCVPSGQSKAAMQSADEDSKAEADAGCAPSCLSDGGGKPNEGLESKVLHTAGDKSFLNPSAEEENAVCAYFFDGESEEAGKSCKRGDLQELLFSESSKNAAKNLQSSEAGQNKGRISSLRQHTSMSFEDFVDEVNTLKKQGKTYTLDLEGGLTDRLKRGRAYDLLISQSLCKQGSLLGGGGAFYAWRKLFFLFIRWLFVHVLGHMLCLIEGNEATTKGVSKRDRGEDCWPQRSSFYSASKEKGLSEESFSSSSASRTDSDVRISSFAGISNTHRTGLHDISANENEALSTSVKPSLEDSAAGVFASHIPSFGANKSPSFDSPTALSSSIEKPANEGAFQAQLPRSLPFKPSKREASSDSKVELRATTLIASSSTSLSLASSSSCSSVKKRESPPENILQVLSTSSCFDGTEAEETSTLQQEVGRGRVAALPFAEENPQQKLSSGASVTGKSPANDAKLASASIASKEAGNASLIVHLLLVMKRESVFDEIAAYSLPKKLEGGGASFCVLGKSSSDRIMKQPIELRSLWIESSDFVYKALSFSRHFCRYYSEISGLPQFYMAFSLVLMFWLTFFVEVSRFPIFIILLIILFLLLISPPRFNYLNESTSSSNEEASRSLQNRNEKLKLPQETSDDGYSSNEAAFSPLKQAKDEEEEEEEEKYQKEGEGKAADEEASNRLGSVTSSTATSTAFQSKAKKPTSQEEENSCIEMFVSSMLSSALSSSIKRWAFIYRDAVESLNEGIDYFESWREQYGSYPLYQLVMGFLLTILMFSLVLRQFVFKFISYLALVSGTILIAKLTGMKIFDLPLRIFFCVCCYFSSSINRNIDKWYYAVELGMYVHLRIQCSLCKLINTLEKEK